LNKIACLLAALALVAALFFRAPEDVSAAEDRSVQPFTSGQLLVATPEMADPRFAHAVIFMVDHNAGGAMGLVVNRSIGVGPLKALLKGFGIEPKEELGTVHLHCGGPVDSARGFVLHSPDYSGPTTKVIDGQVALTTGHDILTALAEGKGPRKSLIILGYTGWGPGQLESEMARDDWLTAPADESLIFDEDSDSVWERAIENAGLTL
jgi:putative transcriptional regulator